MNKLPTKQIYLLAIIIVGIITLSVYSTYALFTFESSTSDIVSIHTPKSLTISENVYEYQQIIVEPNTITTTDIDIYNAFEYDVCYSIWYKVVGDTVVQNKVQVFEKSEEVLTTSGVLQPTKNIRITIVIINDNDTEVKVNLGTIGAQKQDDSCALNITSDKDVISINYNNLDILTSKILSEKDIVNELEANYLTYKDITETIQFKSTEKIYTSEKFTYNNEIFTLTNAEETTVEEAIKKNNLQLDNIYFCKGSNECSILYKISTVEKKSSQDGTVNYNITKYDKLIGYSKGTNGLRKVNEKDYVYYGDNPNNYIYYNCLNNDDLTTCELWRIVGFFYDEETKEYKTKIVRNDSIGKYQYDYKIENDENKSTNNWNESTLNKYLNEKYKLKSNNDIYIDEYIQQVERIPNLETDVQNIKIKDENINSKITILSLSDYLYASSCKKTKVNEYTGSCLTNNWLNNIEISSEWTLTSKEVEIPEPIIEETTDINITEETQELENSTENTTDSAENNETNETEDNVLTESETNEEVVPVEEEDNYIINYVYSIGKNITEYDVNDSLEIRPVVFLKPRMLLMNGKGTFENPYIIK